MEDGEYHSITVSDSSSEEKEVSDNEEYVAAMRRRLKEKREEIRKTTTGRSSVCIYRVPPSLFGISQNAIQPEMVSIGPYHRGKEELLEFESHKWQFLEALLFRTNKAKGHDLKNYFKAMKQLEESTRKCYSEFIPMSSTEFVEMMVLDGCFIIELFRRVCKKEDEKDEKDPILSMPWLIPLLTRDLLKLENQLPYLVLEKLFELSRSENEEDPLNWFAFKFFDLSLPRPSEVIQRSSMLGGAMHLLDLFHLSFTPPISDDIQSHPPSFHTYNAIFQSQVKQLLHSFQSRFNPSSTPHDHSNPSFHQSIQCTTQLRPSGIEFRPHRAADSFLDISYQSRVLQIPPITINDFTTTIFINCMALEQCHPHSSTCFITYVAFMSCLINSTRDVAFLCADGIITGFSQNDQNIAALFGKLGEKVIFNIRDQCYLSKQFRDLKAYYSTPWATLMRTYFSRPWSFISAFAAFSFLILFLILFSFILCI